MAKKAKSMSKADDQQLAEAVRTSAQQIWQAGLGAFAKAQEEGGKVFAKLVKEGTELQKRTQRLAEGKMTEVTGTVSKVADSVSKQAAGSWDKLEQVFEERVARSLTSLGVPSQKDLQALTKRIDELNKTVMALSAKGSGAKPAKAKPAAKTTARTTGKTAAKATARKTARKAATK